MKKMLTKLKMSLTNNIGLKFLAVLIALVLCQKKQEVFPLQKKAS